MTDVTTKQQDADFKVLSPVPRDRWESLTRSCPNFVATQSLHWRDAILASGAYKDVCLLYEFSSGKQVLLPMVQRRWRTPLEPTAASWPRRWGVGGPITSGGSIDPAEAAAVLSHVVRRDMLGAEIHLSHITDPVSAAGRRPVPGAHRPVLRPGPHQRLRRRSGSTSSSAPFGNQSRRASGPALTSRSTTRGGCSRSSTGCMRSRCSAGRR